MADIQVGDKVRILANDNGEGHQWEPSNLYKHLKPLKAEHLNDKLGTVISAMGDALSDDEVFVKLDNGWTVIIQKHFLFTLKPTNR